MYRDDPRHSLAGHCAALALAVAARADPAIRTGWRANGISPCLQPANGQLEQLLSDRDHDGRSETRAFMDGAVIKYIEIDRNGDGLPDRWEYYGSPAVDRERAGASATATSSTARRKRTARAGPLRGANSTCRGIDSPRRGRHGPRWSPRQVGNLRSGLLGRWTWTCLARDSPLSACDTTRQAT